MPDMKPDRRFVKARLMSEVLELSCTEGEGSEREIGRYLCLSSWQLRASLWIGVTVNDSPSVWFAPKHHRYPQVEGRWVNPARNAEPNMLGLDKISELGSDGRSNFLSTTCTFGKLWTSPVEPRCHFVPSRLHAPKSTVDADVAPVGPKRLECRGVPLDEFVFCGFELRHEVSPLWIGDFAKCLARSHLTWSQPRWASRRVNLSRLVLAAWQVLARFQSRPACAQGPLNWPLPPE